MQRLSFPVFVNLEKASGLAFTQKAANAIKYQVQYMQEGCHVLKQLEKYRKLGSDAEARVKNDVKCGAIFGYLKQLEQLAGTREKASTVTAALSGTDPVEFSKLKEVELCTLEKPFNVPEDVLESMRMIVSDLDQQVDKGLDRLSDITCGLHLPDKTWTAELKKDSPIADVKKCASSKLDFDVSGLQGTLDSLKEATTPAKLRHSFQVVQSPKAFTLHCVGGFLVLPKTEN